MSITSIKNIFGLYYVSISLGLALIIGSQYFTYRSVRKLSLNNERLNVTIGVLNQTANYGLTTKDFHSNMRGYLITQNTNLLADNYKLKVQLLGISDTLFNLVRTDPVQTARVRDLMEISSKIVAYSQDIIEMYRNEGQEKTFEKLRKGEGIKLNTLLTEKIKEMDAYENHNLEQHRKLVAITQKNSILFILVTSFVGFSLTFLSIYFLNRDKGKQRQLQKEIAEKERVLNQYLEAIPDGVMVINKRKEIVLLNQSGREILGIKASKVETLDDNLSQVKLVDPTRYHVRFTTESLPISRGLEGEKLIGNKIDLIKDNKIYHLETNVQPVIGLDGEITSAITVFRDITERANYEATLEKARVLAEKSVRVKDIFLSNVSHEIRTPLNAIIGFTNLLFGEVTSPKSLEFVSYIQVASKNLLELINDILDFSKIEAGQVQLEKIPTSINELVESISVIVNQRANEKGIHYQYIMSKELPEVVETDKLRLTQILLNVCGNAVKFTENGSVKLLVEPVGEIINDVQMIRFEVRDTGIGISKDKINDVFNRFVQATESTTRIFGGTGLGLSIVKSLVHIFDGTLNLQSEIGKGSTFTIEFPLKVLNNASLPEETDKEIISYASIASMRVLAAEDNILNQKLLQAIFQKLGVDLTIVNNGQEALDVLAEKPFDLILMDIQMPVMDGYTAIKQIRSTISKTIPIITMTAHAMVGEKEECLSIGANSYISKPFKEKELMFTISQLGSKDIPESAAPQPAPAESQNKDMSSLLNLDYLMEITGGDVELRQELVSLFENDYKVQLGLIDQSAVAKDGPKLAQAIHKYRSSLFSVGLLSTANQYKELETMLKQGNWEADTEARLNQLKAESDLGFSLLKEL